MTPDRNLARRVAAELGRWDIAIDDSAGRPLAHTGAGAFLCLVAEAAEAGFAPVPLLALLKHPLAAGARTRPHFAPGPARWTGSACAGPRPDRGLASIAKVIAPGLVDAGDSDKKRNGGPGWASADVAAALGPLEEAFAAEARDSADDLIAVHLEAAEPLTCDDGTERLLWRGADGEAAAGFSDHFLAAGRRGLPPVEPQLLSGAVSHLAMKAPCARALAAIRGSPSWARWKRGC